MAETGLGVALVICAALLARSFVELRAVDPGFRPEQAFATRLVLSRWRHPDPTARGRVVTEALERLRRLPGVTAVGATSRLPLHDPASTAPLTVDGAPILPAAQRPRIGSQSVSGDYFRAAGIPLRAGREFDARDGGAGVRTVVVNEAFARRYLEGSGLGARLRFGGASEPGPVHLVIGVVGDARDRSLREPPSPQVYLDYRQSTPADFSLVVRGPSVGAIAPAVRRELETLDPLMPISRPIELGQVLADASAGDRFMVQLVAMFAGLSLLLAGVGIYGTLTEAVASRTREMGVRLALGARPADVRRLVLGEGGLVLAAAIAVGVPLAALGAQSLRGLLYGIGVADPLAYATAIATVVVAAAVACYLPARRAGQVDPMVALRGE
jgi:predicted permease